MERELDAVIDAEYREVPQALSAYGLPKTEYPEDSLIATEGCGHKHNCYSCSKECDIRGEERYCVEAPMGNPFSCTTMNVLENLEDEFAEECQFINTELAEHRAGDGEPVPCCKKCNVFDCGYRCRRASNLGLEQKEEVVESESESQGELPAVKQLLDAKKKELNDYLSVDGIPENTIFEKKTIVAALANMVCELEDMEETEEEKEVLQPELPVLKNNDQRKEWLAKYKEWGMWYRDENIDVNYYKYDFPDGSRLVVAEYPNRHCYWNDKTEDEYHYHLLERNKKSYNGIYDEKYRQSVDSETYLVEFLKNLQKKVNKVNLIGRLTREPEIRYAQTENATAVARFTLAVDRKYNREESSADFISCVSFGKYAEVAEKYFHKGTKIAITGRIQTGSYTNKDGVRVYTTDVVIEEQEFAENKHSNSSEGSRQPLPPVIS